MIQGPAGLLRWAVIVVSIWMGLASLRAFADDAPMTAGAKKKKIVYRSHTQVDLTGETVQGKIRAPEVFYIFQRKRSQSHHVVAAPDNFDYHDDALKSTLGRSLPK